MVKTHHDSRQTASKPPMCALPSCSCPPSPEWNDEFCGPYCATASRDVVAEACPCKHSGCDFNHRDRYVDYDTDRNLFVAVA